MKFTKDKIRTKDKEVLLDTAAHTTVAGITQAKAYCRFMGVKFRPKKMAIDTDLETAIKLLYDILQYVLQS